jgi:hypothetical protein
MWIVELVPLLLIALTAGVPIYFIRRYLKVREREAAALEGRRAAGANQPLLEEENRKLRERVERLEAIVTSAEYDLNRKLAALPDPNDGSSGRKT